MRAPHQIKLLILASLVVVASLAFAAVPQTINYQGYLKDSAGTPVSAATSVRFSLYSSNPARSNPVWTETKDISPSNGIYSTQLGSVTPITAPFDVPYWLGVKVEGDSEMPMQPLSSVPYALRAASMDAGPQMLFTGGAANVGLVVKGASGQSADLQQWQNSLGTPVASISATGVITGDGSGLTNVQKKYARVAVVAQSGGDYTDPISALADFSAWCPSRSANSRCLLKIMPGTYDIGSSPLTMLQYMDIEGSGPSGTVIAGAVTSSSTTPPANGVVNGARDSELRKLTVVNTASGSYVAAIVNSNVSSTITDVNAITTGAAEESYALYNYYASPTLLGVTATSTGATSGYGVYNFYSSPAMSEVAATGSGSANGFGVMNVHSSPTIQNSTVRGLNSAFNYGINNTSSSTVTLTNVTVTAMGSPGTFNGAITTIYSTLVMTGGSATASGGTWNYGITNESSSAVYSNVNASGKGGTSNYGMANNDNGTPQTVLVDRCTLEGSSDSVSNSANVSVKIGASKLLGPINSIGTITYLASYNDTTTLDSATIGTQTFQTGAAGNRGLIIKGAAGQSANLQEWQNNAGTAVASVSSTGAFTGNGSGLVNVGTSGLTDGAVTDVKITGPISDSKLTSNIPRLNTANTFTTGTQNIQTGGSGNMGLVIRGAAGQLANLQGWQDSTGTPLASVSATGVFIGNGSGLTNITPADGSVTDAKISGVISSAKLSSHSGDVTGSHAATTVAGIQGRAVSTVPPVTNNTLRYNGASWAPTADVTGVTAGSGLTGGGTSGTVTVSANLTPSGGNNGTSTTVARGDHLHVRPAFASNETMVTTVIGSTCTNYMSVMITVPAAGTIAVEATNWLLLNHTAGTTDFASINIGGTASDCSDGYGTSAHSVPSVIPSTTMHLTASPRRAFSVAAAGTYTYYLNGHMGTGADASDYFYFARMFATYYPN